MKAALFQGPNKIEVKEIEKPNIQQGEALIKIHYAGICGTDIHIFKGKHPRAQAPLVMGHEFSGVIEEINTEQTNLKIGDRVVVNPLLPCGRCSVCREGKIHLCPNLHLIGIDRHGAFADYTRANIERIIKIPDSLSMEIAALAEPVAVAVHAVRKAQVSVGDKIVVMGGGPIGQLVAQVAKLDGASPVILSEIAPERIDFAQKMGLITANSKDETIKKVTELIRKEGADIVFEAVGVQSTYDYITDIVKPDGKIIAVGAASGPLAVNFWKIFFNELNIIGIHVYDQIAFEIAIQLLNNYTEMFQHFISKVIGYNELQNEFADLAEGNASVMKILVKNE
jgi:(R,R)-butanediol dehydrogenase / meso-butanediol dehydrogenase / diacetyl reductase